MRTRTAFLAALASLAVMATPAAAQTYKVLHVFCETQTCPDGSTPGALAPDGAGNFYGTTRNGGPHGGGTIFELKRRANGSYKFETLYGFCAQENCFDGQLIGGAPVVDKAGNLYGTALAGGETGYNGNVWEFKRATGKIKVLHSFCVSDCSDGAEPMAGLTYAAAATGALYDGRSPLYGVAPFGGAGFQGTVFQLTPGKSGWDFQVIYAFCNGDDCAGGAVPSGPLLPDASGSLYGMTVQGGSNHKGAVFELSPSGGNWNETVLYSFCQQADCADGDQPNGSLALDASGNLFGTASSGGSGCSQENIHCGVAFRLAPDGQQTVLHSFCSQAKCADGGMPMDGIFVAANGDLIGTAEYGGYASSGGVVWRLSGGQFRTLHKFCKGGDCGKGQNPAAVLVPDASGNLLGTTLYGGPNLGGVIYEITP